MRKEAKKISPVLEKIKKYLKSQPDVAAAYLYGSFVKGTASKKSDIDIAILLAKEPPFDRERELFSKLDDLVRPFDADVHVIKKTSSPAYLMNILERGKLIYSRNDTKRINFEVAAVAEYRDTAYLRKIDSYYLDKRFKEGTYGVRETNFRKIT